MYKNQITQLKCKQVLNSGNGCRGRGVFKNEYKVQIGEEKKEWLESAALP